MVVPKGSYHAFTSTTAGRVLFVCAPSGNEEMFLEMGKLGAGATEEQLADVAARFGMVDLPDAGAAAWRPEQARLAGNPRRRAAKERPMSVRPRCDPKRPESEGHSGAGSA